MATVEEANEYLGGFASDIDDELKLSAPLMSFAIVFWVKGQPTNADSMAIFSPPEVKDESSLAMLSAAAILGGGLAS